MTPIAPALFLSHGRATAGRAAVTATDAAPRAPFTRGAARRAR